MYGLDQGSIWEQVVGGVGEMVKRKRILDRGSGTYSSGQYSYFKHPEIDSDVI